MPCLYTYYSPQPLYLERAAVSHLPACSHVRISLIHASTTEAVASFLPMDDSCYQHILHHVTVLHPPSKNRLFSSNEYIFFLI